MCGHLIIILTLNTLSMQRSEYTGLYVTHYFMAQLCAAVGVEYANRQQYILILYRN